MKKIFSILAITMMLVSCSNAEKKTETSTETIAEAQKETSGVEVIYFHGKQRCMTCLAIEKVASETVADKYADVKVKFSVVDIDTPEGELIADKYKIARSSLIVANHKADGNETVENMTEKAFANARKNPEAFSAMLCDVINSLFQ